MTRTGRPRLLLVEDDDDLGRLLTQACHEDGYVVHHVGRGEDALRWASNEHVDVVLLDVMLPGMDGLATLRALRRLGVWCPVIVLTALSSPEHRLNGFAAEADDYVAKPFHLGELLARLRAVRRRGSTCPRDLPWRVGDVVVDEVNSRVTRGAHAVDLTRQQFRILAELLRHAGQTLPRYQLAELAWEGEPPLDSNAVDVHVAAIRRRIDAAFGTSNLRTVRGVGYRWEMASAR